MVLHGTQCVCSHGARLSRSPRMSQAMSWVERAREATAEHVDFPSLRRSQTLPVTAFARRQQSAPGAGARALRVQEHGPGRSRGSQAPGASASGRLVHARPYVVTGRRAKARAVGAAARAQVGRLNSSLRYGSIEDTMCYACVETRGSDDFRRLQSGDKRTRMLGLLES